MMSAGCFESYLLCDEALTRPPNLPLIGGPKPLRVRSAHAPSSLTLREAVTVRCVVAVMAAEDGDGGTACDTDGVHGGEAEGEAVDEGGGSEAAGAKAEAVMAAAADAGCESGCEIRPEK